MCCILQIEELENEVQLLKTELDAEKLKHTKKVIVYIVDTIMNMIIFVIYERTLILLLAIDRYTLIKQSQVIGDCTIKKIFM